MDRAIQLKTSQTGGALALHRSYNFVDKHDAIDVVRTLIEERNISPLWVADQAGCHPKTLQNWFDGKTAWPHKSTLNRVLAVFGLYVAGVRIEAVAASEQNIVRFTPAFRPDTTSTHKGGYVGRWRWKR